MDFLFIQRPSTKNHGFILVICIHHFRRVTKIALVSCMLLRDSLFNSAYGAYEQLNNENKTFFLRYWIANFHV